ncbi:MAG: type III-B CRISPR module RAMP protein Cmr4 [Pseudothermotoga sp.]
MESKVFLIYAETQIHAGKGMDIGAVDLPIQRERTTGFPIIQGIKGALRASIKDNKVRDIFGSEPTDNTNQETKPGRVAFSEAKILLFPVRNPESLFVWVTCPLALIRFLRNFEKSKVEGLIGQIEQTQIKDTEALTLWKETYIWLEEINMNATNCPWLQEFATKIAEQACATQYIKEKLKKDIVVVNDKIFSQIVENMTDVVPRVRIDHEKGTVESGALWYEEYLPQETFMYFVSRKTAYSEQNDLESVEKALDNKVISIGGKETLGKGLVTVKVVSL